MTFVDYKIKPSSSEPASTYPIGASQEPLLCFQSNHAESEGAFEPAYPAMHDTTQGAVMTNRPLSFAPSTASVLSGTHETELHWDIISDFLKEQHEGVSPTNPSSAHPAFIGLSYNQSVRYAWSNPSSNDEASSGVGELEALLSDVRLTTIEHVVAQTQGNQYFDANRTQSLLSRYGCRRQ